MRVKLFLLILVLLCLSGCWRLSDLQGCDDWEIWNDYGNGYPIGINKFPYQYSISACSDTIGLSFKEYQNFDQSSIVKTKVINRFQVLLHSANDKLTGCRLNKNEEPSTSGGGGWHIFMQVLCDQPLPFPYDMNDFEGRVIRFPSPNK